MKQKNGSRPRSVWVDNWLIRERVARWRTRDRVKDWVRRVPRRVVIWVVNIYIAVAAFLFSFMLWWAFKHPYMTIIDGPEAGLATPRLQRAVKPNSDVTALEWLLMDIKSDSGRRKAFEEYLRLNPAMADSLKALQQLYPALRY